ncbi:MAG: hypothetical protein JWO11_793, partial [Nocardioides sp.]|nr:hypothetical protein [Nocardioides sp.]
AQVRSLAELDSLRGRAATDGPLGALLRLAVMDGGGDPLAAVAIMHLLKGGVGRVIRSYGDLSPDIETVVVGALWERIRTFPTERRTHSCAASLILDTRKQVCRMLLPDRRTVPIAPDTPALFVARDLAGSRDGATDEVIDLLNWALAARVIDVSDARVILDLLAAGHEVDGSQPRRALSGCCTTAARVRVAAIYGISDRAVSRRRDRALARLRAAVPAYLAEVS